MISITGLLYKIAPSQNTDRKTGEISTIHSAEILHAERGKSQIASVKLDPLVVDQWSKAVGKEITNEIRFFAMKTTEGGIISGLTLADKKSLPGIHASK